MLKPYPQGDQTTPRTLMQCSVHSDPITVSIEGNIAAGKTTFLKYLAKDRNFHTLPEPVKLWQSSGGFNFLQQMYEEPEKHSFTFQSFAQLTTGQQHLTEVNVPLKIIERSIQSSFHIFTKQMRNTRKITPDQFHVLEKWHQFLTTNKLLNMKLDMIVYLRTTPEIVYARMKERNYAADKLITLEYLKDLHDLHEQWLINSESTKAHNGPELIIIDNDKLQNNNLTYEIYKQRMLTTLNLI